MSCRNPMKCMVNSDETEIQEFIGKHEIVTLSGVDQGAFGTDVQLRICDVNQEFKLEEISLRAEDHIPVIDSVYQQTVFIHYEFASPSDSAVLLPFKSVVLGEALLDPGKLKYNYVFKGLYLSNR